MKDGGGCGLRRDGLGIWLAVGEGEELVRTGLFCGLLSLLFCRLFGSDQLE